MTRRRLELAGLGAWVGPGLTLGAVAANAGLIRPVATLLLVFVAGPLLHAQNSPRVSFGVTGSTFRSSFLDDYGVRMTDGKLAGYARIDGRDVAIVVNDFTVKGASTSYTNSKKIGHMKRTATERGMPLE